MRPIFLIAAALILAGCGHKSAPTATMPTPAKPDPWTITNNDPKAETPALLWNGLIGVRLSTLRGAEEPLFDIDSYQKVGEEKIVPLTSPLDFQIDGDGSDFSPTLSKNFSETLDMRTGEIVQTWTQEGDVEWKIEVRTAIHPDKRIVARRWTCQPQKDASIRIRHELPSAKFTSSSAEKGTATLSLKIGNRIMEIRDIVQNQSPGEWRDGDALPSWLGKVDSDPPVVFETTASMEADKDVPTYDEVAQASKDAWTERWQTDIELDGPVEDQQAIRSFLFYLRGAISPKGKMSISPMGLSSDVYNGHVFWDADIWIFPALALIDPDEAKVIPEYRLAKEEQAMTNFAKWWGQDDRPTATGKLGFLALDGEIFGGKFPWESSVTGNETVPGPSKFEDHITGSVAFSVAQAARLGLVPLDQAAKTTGLAGGFYRYRSVRHKDEYEIYDTVSPNENHTGDNDLYTNLLAQWCANGGSWNEPKQGAATSWYEPMHYKLPKDDKTFLTYDDDKLRSYKQAAAVLSIYPLQFPPAEKEAKAMMDRFADKVIKNGPAMSDSIHAIVWARLGETDKAYEAWHESWQPFVKTPFLLFSEKRNSSRTYFTTGAAGALQAVLYGFAGIRVDEKKAPDAQWSTPLKDGAVLSIAPHLPKEWKKLTLKNLTILGKRYTFEIANDKVSVHPENEASRQK